MNSRNPIKSRNSPRHTEYIQLHFDRELSAFTLWEVIGQETRRYQEMRLGEDFWASGNRCPSGHCLAYHFEAGDREAECLLGVSNSDSNHTEHENVPLHPCSQSILFQQPSSTVLGEGEGKLRPLGPWGSSGHPTLLRVFSEYVL